MAVNVKMGVDVTQFKQGMQQAQQSAKTLNAQLKANESQFKATGDREQYLTEKSKLLKQQFEAQKTAAANAEKALDAMRKNGVEKTSAEYQKMEQALANAQAAMFDAQSAMNGLTESSDKAGKSAGELANSLSSINKKVNLDAVINGIDKITGGLEKAAQKAVSIGQTIWNSVVETAALSDDIATQAMILDISVEDYQKQKKIFDTFAEVTIKDWMNAKRKIESMIYEPSDDQNMYLAMLGVDTHEMFQGKGSLVAGAARRWEDVFWDVVGELQRRVDAHEITGEQANVIGRAIFGKGYDEMKPLIDMGEEEFTSLWQAQSAASEEAVQKNAKFNDSLNLLKANLETLKIEVLSTLAPALTAAAETLSGLLERVMEYLDSPEGQAALQEMEGAVSALFEDLANIDPEDVVRNFVSIFTTLKDAFVWIKDNWGLVKIGLASIVGVLAVGKVTSGALTIVQTLTALKSFGGNGKLPVITTPGDAGTPKAAGTTGTGTAPTVNAAEKVGTQKVSVDAAGRILDPGNAAAKAYAQEFAAAHPWISNAIDFLHSPQGILMMGVITGVPTLDFLKKDFFTRKAQEEFGVSKYGTGFLGLTQIEKDFALGTGAGVIGGGHGETLEDAKAAAARDKAMRKAYMPDFLDWTVDFGDWIEDIMQKGLYGAEKAVNDVGFMWDTSWGLINTMIHGNSATPQKDAMYHSMLNMAPAVLDRVFGDIWGGLKWFGEGMAESAEMLTRAIPVLIHGKNANGDYDQGYTWGQFFRNEVTGAAVGASVDMLKGLEDTKETLAAIQEYLDGISGKKREVTIEVNMLPAGGVPSGGGHGSWGGAGAGTMGQMGFGLNMWGGFVGMHANGLFSVPWDGYPAILHKGERVMTAEENKRYTYNNYFGNVNLNNGLEIEALTESIERRNRRQQSGFGA